MNARTTDLWPDMLRRLLRPDDAVTQTTATAQPEPQTRPEQAAPPPQAGQARTAQHLLYIDDNPVNTLLLQEFFRLRQGPLLQVAQCGEEGLAMARRAPPMAVLLDLHLPDMNGLEVLARLRADPQTCHLPVAMVSGSEMNAQLQQALDLGAHAIWSKPVDFSLLDQQLADLLAQGRS